MDVGIGSGTLEIWCAKASGRRFYVVNATKMLKRAHQLVIKNGISYIVNVDKGFMKNVILLEKVDVIYLKIDGAFSFV